MQISKPIKKLKIKILNFKTHFSSNSNQNKNLPYTSVHMQLKMARLVNTQSYVHNLAKIYVSCV